MPMRVEATLLWCLELYLNERRELKCRLVAHSPLNSDEIKILKEHAPFRHCGDAPFSFDSNASCGESHAPTLRYCGDWSCFDP